MKFNASQRAIGILYPWDATLSNERSIVYAEHIDASDAIYAELCRKTLVAITESLKEAADSLRLHIGMKHFPYYAEEPDRKVRLELVESVNTIVIIDPSDRHIAFLIAAMRKNPLISGLLTYSNKKAGLEHLDGQLDVLAEAALPLATDPPTKQNRVFIALEKEGDQLLQATESAIAYPLNAA